MNQFLQRCKQLVTTQCQKVIVIGNESCDLDSAVCALGLAFHLHHKPPAFAKVNSVEADVLPVLNVTREELPLKTEVTYFLKQHGVSLDSIICRDEIPLSSNDVNVALFLVDHHVTRLPQRIVGVIDHRPLDDAAKLSEEAFRRIELVGSCSTLVADEIVKHSAEGQSLEDGYNTILRLLHGTIILDTVNFSKEADKARPLDYEIVKLLDERFGVHIDERLRSREELFKELVAARSDVSQLDSYQLLLKDLKILSGIDGKVVSVPGFPMSVEKYVTLADVDANLKRFATQTSSSVIVLMGLNVDPTNGTVSRDIKIVCIDDEQLYRAITTSLRNSKSPDFQLEEVAKLSSATATYFRQLNLKASRKQLIPIVKEVLSTE